FDTAREWPYGPQSAAALRFPYGVTSQGRLMAVADTANNRVLLYYGPPGGAGEGAQAVLDQPDFASNGENRWTAVEDDSLCWPYGLWLHGSRLAVADSGNNRILVWDVGAHVAAARGGVAPEVAGAAGAGRAPDHDSTTDRDDGGRGRAAAAE
ncbi:MAG: hypothetical protein AAFX50_20925, partial [Acidobacteriota bacterium]